MLRAQFVLSGFGDEIVVGTDGAWRTLWRSLGGKPGLSWLAGEFPGILRTVGLTEQDIAKVMRVNAVAALTWRPVSGSTRPMTSAAG